MQRTKRDSTEQIERTGIVAFLLLCFLLSSSLTVFAGEWRRDGRGWWYAKDGGGYLKSEWLSDNGRWYHFDTEGYMQTGWIMDAGLWYYLENNGAMRLEALGENGKSYRFSESGACLNPEGEAEHDTMDEKERPATGVLYGVSRGNPCVVHTEKDGKDYYLRFYALSGSDIEEAGTLKLGVYIQDGDSASLMLPSGKYRLVFGSGSRWYGTKYMFGPTAPYMRMDRVLDVNTGYSYEITLYAVPGGNTEISPVPYQTD